MGLFSGILGAVVPKLAGGLASKIFGGGSKSTTSRTNYKQLRDDATAAGFNPLTALRATGGAGNVTTTTPALSTGEFIAEALERGTETWFNREQLARDEEAETIKLATMRAELEHLQNRNSAPSGSQYFGYAIPQAATSAPRTERTSPSLARETAPGTVRPDGTYERAREIILPNGGSWVTGNTDPAEVFEAEYGDPLSWLYGGVRLAIDGYNNLITPMARRHALANDIRDQRDAEERQRRYRGRNVTRNPPRDRFYYQQNPRRY